MFVRNSMNGTVEWLGVPEFLRNDGPPWTLNLLDPYENWEDIGSITNPNWGSQSGGGFRQCYHPVELSRPCTSSLPPEDI